MTVRDLFKSTIFVVVLLLFIVFGGLYGKSKWEEYATDRHTAAAKHQEDIEARIRICREPEGFVAFLSCAYEASAANQGDYTSQHDLKAQQDMSIWAFGMFVTSIATLFVTAFGVFFVWLTLKKADETNRAAITAADAGVVANEIMQQEQRPWLKFRFEGNFKLVNETPFIVYQCLIENVGRRPATNCIICVEKTQSSERTRKLRKWIDENRKSEPPDEVLGIGKIVFPGDTNANHSISVMVKTAKTDTLVDILCTVIYRDPTQDEWFYTRGDISAIAEPRNQKQLISECADLKDIEFSWSEFKNTDAR